MIKTNQHILALITACKNRDEKAQMEIYDRYHKAMYNTAHRIVKSDFEAEDIMQDAFLTAFSKLQTLKDPNLFSAWLKKIVVNKSLHQCKANKRKKEVSFDQMTYFMEAEEADAEKDEYTKLKAREVLEMMENLKENYRLGLTLHLIEGYDYKEISEIMDITYGSCRTMISRAKKSLRKKLRKSVVER